MRTSTVAALVLAVGACSPAPAIREVTVVGFEYAFEVPDTLPAGLTMVSFANRGHRRHELSVTLQQPGVSLSDVMKPDSLSAPEDSLYGPDVGILLAKPGEQPAGRLVVDLQPGRTYLLACDFRDSTRGARHSQMGMIRTIAVR